MSQLHSETPLPGPPSPAPRGSRRAGASVPARIGFAAAAAPIIFLRQKGIGLYVPFRFVLAYMVPYSLLIKFTHLSDVGAIVSELVFVPCFPTRWVAETPLRVTEAAPGRLNARGSTARRTSMLVNSYRCGLVVASGVSCETSSMRHVFCAPCRRVLCGSLSWPRHPTVARTSHG